MIWKIGDNDALCSVKNNSCTLSMLYFLEFLTHYLGYSYDKNYISQYEKRHTFDFIIVGGGTAGCVIANRLSEISNWTVLLLEQGDEEPIITEVPGLQSFLKGSTITNTFSTQSEPNACGDQSNHSCHGTRGNVLGGSSTTLGSYLMRGNKWDYDHWANIGNTGWGWIDVLSYFKKSENMNIPDLKHTKYHGVGGYLNVEESNFYDPNNDILLKAWKEFGLDIIDYNSGNNLGASILQYSHVNGARQSSNGAYLRPIRGTRRPNLIIRTKAKVTKIIIDPKTKKATGVEYKSDNLTKIVKANMEVILSAGPVNSPKLLMLSGVGPKDNLEEAGIDVIVDLSVGQNLHNHFGIEPLQIEVKKQNEYFLADNLQNDVVYWLSSHKGKMSTSSNMDVIAFLQTSFEKHSDYPDIMIMFNKYKHFLNSSHYLSLPYYDGFTIEITNVAPKSRGTLKLNIDDPTSNPNIRANFMTHPDDLKVLIEGAKMVVKVVNTNAFKIGNFTVKRPLAEHCDHLEFNTDDYYACLAMNHTKIIANLVGTCKMGPETKSGAVVDTTLKVHDIHGLRVIDESIMPVVTRGSMIWPIIMIAEKGSDMIKEDYLDKVS